MSIFDKSVVLDKMNKTIASFKKDLSSLRTGRANPAMLDLIRVDVYGQKMPINQIATITVPEPRTISIQVWDKNNVNLVDTEIKKSNLGVNPQVDGQMLRIRIPQLTEERRKELTKIASQYSENSKVVIRNLRRDYIDIKKNEKKDSQISEDELKKYINEAQKSTDLSIEKIEKLLESKKTEILKV